MNKLCFYIVCAILTISNARGSDIINVSAVNKNIVVLHFDDGYVRYHQKGESRKNEWVVSNPLNINKAVDLNNYSIKGKEGVYAEPKKPVKIERKSKGTEFTWLCENWSGTNGCSNNQEDHSKEHWIYLYLPEPLEMGKTYTITTGDVAENGKAWNLDFSLEKNRTEAIHVNIIGYSPNATKKYGYVYHWGGSAGGIDFKAFTNNNFYLINTKTKEKVFSGQLKFRKSKTNKDTYQNDTPGGNYNGADIYECDFSNFNTPGEYILAIEEIGHSFPFKIQKDIYRLPFYTSVRGLYHNRSGIALKQPFTNYTRPAPQNPTITPGFAGKLKYTSSRFVDWKNTDHSSDDTQTIIDSIKGAVNTWGWYQDAGDWDGYFNHLKIPVLLMLTWEIAPEKFADGGLNLPEGKNQIPDILDEARWLLNFFQRTRKELIDKGFGTGGIGSRVAPDWFGKAGDGVPSYEDKRQWIISGEDPFTSYFYAGLAAHYANILNKLEVQDTIDWKKEAEESYQWALNNTRQTDLIAQNVHGLKLNNFRLYAASTLWRLTGKEKYLQAIQSFTNGISTGTVLDENQKWGPYALICGSEREFPNEALFANLKGAVIKTADDKFSSASTRALRFGGGNWMPMLVGQATTPRVFEIMMGHYISKVYAPNRTKSYLEAIFTTADYFLGCNAHNMAWVTKLGVRHPNRLLHIDSWYGNETGMIPGITPYGPWRDDGYSGPIGPWTIQWPYKTIFPEGINNWPGHERWFNNYTTPSNAEFTIHQNTVFSAVVYGYLCDVPDGTFKPNKKPQITITSPIKNAEIEGEIRISASVNDPDGEDDIAWVEYYNGWHKIGQSNNSPYSFTWKNPKYGIARINARIIDKRGYSGISDTIEVKVIPSNFDVSIIVLDSLTRNPVENCNVSIEEKRVKTDHSGKAFFQNVSGIMDISLTKSKYVTKNISRKSVYSDTTLIFFLTPLKNDISIVVQDVNTGELFEGISIIFNSIPQITNSNGEAFFYEYTGDYDYSIIKKSYKDENGTLSVNSDTTFYFFLVRTEAEIKFVLKENGTPVNNAKIVLNNDSILSSTLGISRFKSLEINKIYNYNVSKYKYKSISGDIYLNKDTIVNIAMQSYPVGVKKVNSIELKTWPNPITESVFIQSNKAIREISILNIAGSKVLYRKIDNKSHVQLNSKALNSGIYLLHAVHEGGSVIVKKIVKN